MISVSDLLIWTPLLYVPGNRPGLKNILSGAGDLGVCSVAVCLEDAVKPADRKMAATMLCRYLSELPELPRPIFVRPADSTMLEFLLDQTGIERVRGFILPKATVDSIHRWIERTNGLFQIFPIMESLEALDPLGRRDLAHACAAHKPMIAAARIGANDLLSLLGGLRRPSGKTIYETPVGNVIHGLIEAFCSHGIPLCGPVFDRFSDKVTMDREIDEDMNRGLFGKTAITPAQVHQIWRRYKPTEREVSEARSLLNIDAPAVFVCEGAMLEPACHSEWARRLLLRDSLHSRLSWNDGAND